MQIYLGLTIGKAVAMGERTIASTPGKSLLRSDGTVDPWLKDPMAKR
jgi:hypothetical protein